MRSDAFVARPLRGLVDSQVVYEVRNGEGTKRCACRDGHLSAAEARKCAESLVRRRLMKVAKVWAINMTVESVVTRTRPVAVCRSCGRKMPKRLRR